MKKKTLKTIMYQGKVVLITGNKKTGKMFGEEINDNNIDLFKDQNFFLKAIINIK